jgi:hypothetical protein
MQTVQNWISAGSRPFPDLAGNKVRPALACQCGSQMVLKHPFEFRGHWRHRYRADVTFPKVSHPAMHHRQAIVVWSPEQKRDAKTNINCHGACEELPDTFLLRIRFRIRDGDELRSAKHQLRIDAGVERQ